MLFSVVMPTYNRAERTAAAVRSVLAQTEADFECFVVDDGSTDETRQVLARFDDPRLVLVFNERNRGQHACRNQAIRQARGEWISFLDSDDVYLPGRLAAMRRYAESAPRTGFLFTNGYVHRYGRIIGLLFDPARELPRGKVPGYYAVGDEFLPYVTTMVAVRRTAFEQVGCFREDLRILEDTELYSRMLEAGVEVGAIPEPLAVRFIHEGQITRDHLKDFEESLVALRSSGAPAEVQARIRARVAREVAEHLWRGAEPRRARELLARELGSVGGAFYLKTLAPSPLLLAARKAR
ncbi:MAG: glycosyltransferase family 2 protein, partial [Elusimicrobia bacterium]|nr:glycosyltransferase family 2 protein [Elusimicrobiota bacterium]